MAKLRTTIEKQRVDFPIDLFCPECGEKAKYNFEVEESREEYLGPWRMRHAEKAACAACIHVKSKKKRAECYPCRGTGFLWPYRRDGHKRSLIPMPRINLRVKRPDPALYHFPAKWEDQNG